MHVSDRLDKWSWFRRDSLGRVDRTIMPRRKDSRVRKSITDGRYRPSGERQLWGQTYPFRGQGAKSGFGATSPLTTALARARITPLLSHPTFAIGTALDAPFAATWIATGQSGAFQDRLKRYSRQSSALGPTCEQPSLIAR
jgi:hypothetical protein